MAEETPNPETTEAADASATPEGGDAAVESAAEWTAWRNLWQVPAIVGSLGAIALAIVVASNRAPAEDWDGALDEVARLIELEQFDTARSRLVDVLEPNLFDATTRQRARFHALAADWVGRSQERRGDSLEANEQIIEEQYGRAVSLGLVLDAERIERWGRSQLSLDQLDEVRDRVLELETLADAGDDDAARRRNRLLRSLVERNLQDGNLAVDAMIAALTRYREDPRLADSDRAWSIARETDLRIEAGRWTEASRTLLVGMRRLETAEAELEADVWAGFYVRLAEIAHRLGNRDETIFNLDRADERFENATLERGRGDLLRADLAIEDGDWDNAIAYLEGVIDAFPATDLELPSRLRRAEALGVVGRHADARQEYRQLVESVAGRPSDRDVRPRTIADALVDRHDSLLAVGSLDDALAYIEIGESLYDPLEVPADVLEALAGTNRTLAESLLRSARRDVAAAATNAEAVDPADIPEAALPSEVRAEAQIRFEDSARYALRHAAEILAVPGADESWARSLWLAADAFDRAGLPDEAIDAMESYLEARKLDDPRRPEVLLRLGRTLASIDRHEDAIERFRQVSADHPRSPFGTEAFSPLASSLLALDRDPEAEQVLLAVVEGRGGETTALTPDARDFRQALVDLGRLYVRDGRYRDAVERLDAALARDPDGADANELRSDLAISHAGLASEITDRLASGPPLAPGETSDLEARRAAHLESALDLHDQVVNAFGDDSLDRLDSGRRAMLRAGMFGRARAAYDLGRWEQAARLYDAAARRYADQYASLQALVQIVNAYERLGDQARADIAHRNALVRLAQLPDEAFASPEAVLDRTTWEQWLRDRPVGTLASVGGTGSGATP